MIDKPQHMDSTFFAGVLNILHQNSYALRRELSWTHYCLIMRVENQPMLINHWHHTLTEKDEPVVKYSILNDSKQLFATKYMAYLPTEAELVAEIEREKRLITERWERNK